MPPSRYGRDRRAGRARSRTIEFPFATIERRARQIGSGRPQGAPRTLGSTADGVTPIAGRCSHAPAQPPGSHSQQPLTGALSGRNDLNGTQAVQGLACGVPLQGRSPGSDPTDTRRGLIAEAASLSGSAPFRIRLRHGVHRRRHPVSEWS